jgi:hypothetical protein
MIFMKIRQHVQNWYTKCLYAACEVLGFHISSASSFLLLFCPWNHPLSVLYLSFTFSLKIGPLKGHCYLNLFVLISLCCPHSHWFTDGAGSGPSTCSIFSAPGLFFTLKMETTGSSTTVEPNLSNYIASHPRKHQSLRTQPPHLILNSNHHSKNNVYFNLLVLCNVL